MKLIREVKIRNYDKLIFIDEKKKIKIERLYLNNKLINELKQFNYVYRTLSERVKI